jgi:hypothetical protein
MNKLQQVIAWLTAGKIYEGNNYVYFQSGTGEPHTVIEQEDELILSGNKPGGPISRFSEVNACVQHIASIAP